MLRQQRDVVIAIRRFDADETGRRDDQEEDQIVLHLRRRFSILFPKVFFFR